MMRAPAPPEFDAYEETIDLDVQVIGTMADHLGLRLIVNAAGWYSVGCVDIVWREDGLGWDVIRWPDQASTQHEHLSTHPDLASATRGVVGHVAEAANQLLDAYGAGRGQDP